MSDIEKSLEAELESMAQEVGEEEDVKLPTLEEQKAIVEALKNLEAKGELTPEVLEKYFGQFNNSGQFNNRAGKPIH